MNPYELPPAALVINDNAAAQLMMLQLGILGEYSVYNDMPDISVNVIYENHPTHWILVSHTRGNPDPKENGYCLTFEPKQAVTKKEFEQRIRRICAEKGDVIPEGNLWNRLPNRPEFLS